MSARYDEERNEFMSFLSESLESDEDNYRYNSILEAADEYADAETGKVKRRIQRKVKNLCNKYGIAYGKSFGGFAEEIAAIFEQEGDSDE